MEFKCLEKNQLYGIDIWCYGWTLANHWSSVGFEVVRFIIIILVTYFKNYRLKGGY